MLGFALVILFLFSKTFANTHVNQSLDNGWVPLISADVSNEEKNGALKRIYDVSWNQAEYFDVITENALKIVLSQPSSKDEIFYYSPRDTTAFDIPPVNRKNQERTLKLKYSHENEIFANIPDLQNNDQINETENGREITTEHNQRQPKQIDGHDIVSEFKNLYEIGIKSSDSETVAPSTISIRKQMNLKKYDVTEPSNVEETTQETDKNNRGYIYRPPLVVPFHPVRNGITKKLYNNLIKYNIRSNDTLNNYAVSKKIQNYNTMFDMYRHHLEPVVPVPFRYNSLNHLPVNPLLAVFLSNYGYYTKNFYGPQNNYRNLYGYTASNNIHNNYPFGSYKIFSDTDSSH